MSPRHVVLDNEAVDVVLRARPGDARVRPLLTSLLAATGTVAVPTAVRVEAGWDRRDPRAARANQIVQHDDPLDTTGGDRAAELRAAVPTASVVDTAVAVTAERLAGGDTVVDVLTSDVDDLTALAAQLDGRVHVKRL